MTKRTDAKKLFIKNPHSWWLESLQGHSEGQEENYLENLILLGQGPIVKVKADFGVWLQSQVQVYSLWVFHPLGVSLTLYAPRSIVHVASLAPELSYQYTEIFIAQ